MHDECVFMKDGQCIILFENACEGCPIRGAASDVLPCPFCGCEARAYQLSKKSRYAGMWAIGCREDESCLGHYKNVRRLFPQKADAVAAWNFRAGKNEGQPYPTSLCGRIHWLKDLYGLTITEICERAQMSDAYFREWQRGICEPRATDVGRVAEILNVTCDFLLIGGRKYDAPYMFPMNTIAERIKMLRMENLMTQKDMWEKIGRGHGTVYRWETGQIQPRASDIVKLSEMFQVSCEWIIHGENRNLLEKKRLYRKG